MKRRVVLTGVGLVSALGLDTESTWSGLLQGKSGVGPITRFDASDFSSRIAAEVKDLDPLDYVDTKNARKMDLFILYAIVASDVAVKSASLSITKENAERIGVYIGSGIGGFGTIEAQHTNYLNKGPRKISPFFIPASISNLATGQVSIRLGTTGPNSATCTACSAGCHAIGDSFKIIERGAADVMIAGGSEAAITPMGVGGFAAMRALSTRNEEPERASRPFDRDRDGFVIGEGSGIVVLEELEHARRRDAQILAEIVGYGMSGDAYHITAPPEDGSGATRVMRATLEDAGVDPTEVDYINAHGTSTPPNDRIETRAIKAVFSDHAYKLAISSTKSMTGHLLGAAGGLEAGVSVLVLRDQIIPPTINLENPDPDCDLDYVPGTARKAEIRYVLSSSFGFGGTNACILLKRYPDN
ncbi:MAG: beta-ketoacyl-[acyl-carrier-protein] synthase II [Acidobacteria bacterium]|nr:MAG: beta-ketoacyl-[acyl-carrier-protein] synthase II [Acidobacteriota bacterium]